MNMLKLVRTLLIYRVQGTSKEFEKMYKRMRFNLLRLNRSWKYSVFYRILQFRYSLADDLMNDIKWTEHGQ